MAALGGSYAKVVESSLDNNARARDFVPFHGNSEPGIIRSPASYSDQQIRAIRGAQHAVEVSYGFGHLQAAAALEAMRINDHDIMQILDPSVAQNLAALAEQLLRLDTVDY